MNTPMGIHAGRKDGIAEIGWLIACLAAVVLADAVLARVIGLF